MEPSSIAPHFSGHIPKHGSPLDEVVWTRRTAMVGDFVQENVEAPESWSDNAVGISAKLYFATVDGVRESSVRAMIERVAGRITSEGLGHGYFGDASKFNGHDPSRAFYNELCYLLVNQMAAFNTPVWLNVGVPGRKQVCSACFLLKLEDSMVAGPHSITKWIETEARIFKGGAGSGINVSPLRGSMEPLSTGGMASGPTSYMRSADASAGTLKSGGAHRRAAKMVIENADHPDIRDFIDCKRREDRRMRKLAAAGEEINPFTPSGEKVIAETTSFQNANLSVGASDEFMRHATAGGVTARVRTGPTWDLLARTTGDPIERVSAHDLLDDIAAAAWECGDPGMVFLDTVNMWHTTPSLGPITTCNPCAETWLNDDSSCNLASLNLVRFMNDDGAFDLEAFRAAIDVMVTAMDITCSFSDLPTPSIEKNTRELRQLGLGYSNLGAAVMSKGMPYDSEEARDWAASVTALMTGRAYRRSAELAQSMGAYARFEENREAHLGVMKRHWESLPPTCSGIWAAAGEDWAGAMGGGASHGYRNSQATVIAPTGTISYLMDCDTTGIEPDFSLVKHKGLAGGGSMVIVNQSARRAAAALGGYSDENLKQMAEGNFDSISEEDRPVFACANDISPMGHLRMVAAVQPFLSGAPSKTINLANAATKDEVRSYYVEAWKLGCKAVSIYRDGSKATQVLTSSAPEVVEAVMADIAPPPVRRRLPRERQSITHKFDIGGHEGYITAGMYDDGTLGEFFLTGVGKEGSFLQGMMGQWSIACSVSFQYGVPLEVLCRKYIGMEFEPRGYTGNPDIPEAKSIPDYLFRWLAARFLDTDTCEEFGVLTSEVKQRMAARLDMTAVANAREIPGVKTAMMGSKPCTCGGLMVQSGSCYTCSSCGNNTGCG